MIDSELGRLLLRAVLPLLSIGIVHPQAASGQKFTIPTNGSSPSGIARGSDGNIWFTENSGGKIGRVTITESPIPTASSAPLGITAGLDGQLWFVEGNANQTGRITVNGSPPSASIAAPPSVCAATGGNAASVPDAGSGTSYLWSISNGTITAGAGTVSVTFSSGATGAVGLSISVMNGAGSATGSKSVPISGFCPVFAEFPLPPDPSGFTPAPDAITPGPDGNLWFTDTNNAAPKIGRITTAGALTLFPLPAGMSIPLGIGAGPDGNLWYTRTPFNGGTDEIGRITTSGSIVEYPLAGATNPGGIVAGPDGALWFAKGVCPGGFNCTVGRVTTSGTITSFPVNGANTDITVGPDGAFWFTEFASDSIGRMTTVGTLTEYPLPTLNVFPERIALGPDGALWFTEYYGNAIGRITTSGVITEYPLPTPKSFPIGISSGPDGNVWFTEFDYDPSCTCYRDPPRIGQITPAGQITEFIVPTARNGLMGITTGPDGKLWFTESYAGKIGRMTVPTTHPTVTSIAPTTGSPFGGTSVIIRGTNFVQGASVFIGGAAPLEAAVIDSTTIFATTASHVPGAADVVVTNPDSSSGTLPSGFTYLTPTAAPTVASVNPPSGSSAGGTSVTITGTGFAPGAAVSIGGVAAALVNVMNNTTLTAVTGPHSSGSVDVSVTNVASPPGTLSSGYQYVDSPLGFFTVAPCRVVDTRGSGGPYGAPWLAAQSTRSFAVSGQCGIPSTARAVAVNITITQPTGQGDLRLFPGGTLLPLVSSMNYRPGQTRANNAIVLLGAAGDITVRCDQVSGTVQFIFDVNGYLQ